MLDLKEARYIRKLRKELDWKQEYVAHKLNISAALYGEIERNISQPSAEVIKNIYDLYDFKCDIDDKKRNKLNDLFKSIYYCQKNSKDIYDSIKKYEDIYENSVLFIDYWLCIYIYKVTIRLNVERYYSLLKSWERYLTNEEKEFFTLYQCIQLRNEDKIEKAVTFIEKLYSKRQTNLYLQAILCYHAAPIYYSLGNLVESYKMVTLGKEIFKETFCETRYQLLNCQEANIYMMSKMYEQADRIYSDLIFNYKAKLLEVDYNSIICNATWNMIQLGNYHIALHYLGQRTDGCLELSYFHFNYVWVLFKTGQEELAIIYINDNIKKVKDAYLKRLMRIVECLIEDPLGTELLRRLKECEKYLDKTASDQDAFLFVNNLLLEYYQRKGNKKQLIKYLQKRISL